MNDIHSTRVLHESPQDNLDKVPGPSAPRAPGLFPQNALHTHMMSGKDLFGFAAAVTITLGPLVAYSLGLGA